MFFALHSLVPRFTGKTRITGKTAEIPERPKINRELKYAIQFKGIIPIRINHFSSHRNISKFSKASRIKVKDDLNFYRQAQIS